MTASWLNTLNNYCYVELHMYIKVYRERERARTELWWDVGFLRFKWMGSISEMKRSWFSLVINLFFFKIWSGYEMLHHFTSWNPSVDVSVKKLCHSVWCFYVGVIRMSNGCLMSSIYWKWTMKRPVKQPL